jgi:signal peptidase II
MFKNRYYLIAFLILVLDHVTKWAVRVKLDRDLPVTLIRATCAFLLGKSGVAFGLFDSVVSVWKPYVLAAMAVVAVTVVVIYSLHLPPERRLLHVALAVLTGGILGNFVDRLLRGYVVDFIDFHIHDIFTWPTFNVADSAITIGIALLLIDTVLNPAVEKAAEPPPIHSPE